MPRINIYLDDETMAKMKGFAEESGIKPSKFIKDLILDYETQNHERIEHVMENIKSLKRSEYANGRNLSALIEMFNTFLKTFAVGEANENVFYPSKESPHPWLRKAYEEVEANLRVAIYNKK